MAYTAEQKTTVARELARAGGNVTAALRRLRDEYETFREISVSTLRRMLRLKGFPELVAAEGETLHAARAAGVAAAESERARREVQGTIVARMAHDEAILDALRERVEIEIKRPEFDATAAVHLYAQMTAASDRRKAILMPALAESTQGAALVEALAEELYATLGQARTREIIGRVKARYIQKIEAAEQAKAQPAEASDGQPH